jgi:hypothetical protein
MGKHVLETLTVSQTLVSMDSAILATMDCLARIVMELHALLIVNVLLAHAIMECVHHVLHLLDSYVMDRHVLLIQIA